MFHNDCAHMKIKGNEQRKTFIEQSSTGLLDVRLHSLNSSASMDARYMGSTIIENAEHARRAEPAQSLCAQLVRA